MCGLHVCKDLGIRLYVASDAIAQIWLLSQPRRWVLQRLRSEFLIWHWWITSQVDLHSVTINRLGPWDRVSTDHIMWHCELNTGLVRIMLQGIVGSEWCHTDRVMQQDGRRLGCPTGSRSWIQSAHLDHPIGTCLGRVHYHSRSVNQSHDGHVCPLQGLSHSARARVPLTAPL